ncbi:hypothetical protein [Streptomyces chartreusis]|uniref:hypothetical protein n=1 Tax=Streptomyces chartreusis TaxID=1969 RepID=UPI00364D65BE
MTSLGRVSATATSSPRARDVLLRLQEYGTVAVDVDQAAGGLVIGSNGGGCPTSRALMERSTGRGRRRWTNPELDKVADGLRQFLELLERSLTRWVADREPGHL